MAAYNSQPWFLLFEECFMQIDQSIADLEQACQIITHTQTLLDSWYGPTGYKLMHARTYLENTYLHPLIASLLADDALETAVPCAEIGGAR